MSRSYDFAVEASPVSETDSVKVMNAVAEKLGAYTVDFFHNGDTVAIDGSCTLCVGKLEDEAHLELLDRIRKEFPTLTNITSFWRCTEWQEWDESFCWQKEDENETTDKKD